MNATTNIAPAPKPKQMRKRLSNNAWVIIVVSALMAGFAIYAVFNWFEIVEEEKIIGATGEALTNPYHGLQQFLVASGARITVTNKANELERGLAETSTNTILLGDRRLAEMTKARVDKINAWVEAGGHLIVEAEQPTLEDPILARYSIDRKRLIWRNNKFVEVERIQSGKNADADADADDGDNPTNAENEKDPPSVNPENFAKYRAPEHLISKLVLADGTPFMTKFQPYQNLLKTPILVPVAQDPRVLASDRNGGRIVEFTQKRGRVTVMSNFDLMTYKNLEIVDHAEFTWHIVSSANALKPQILVALNRQGDGFWKWMTTHAWMVAFASVALLIFWLWRVIPRMGPLVVIDANAHSRRSLLEHMAAAGAFLVKQNQWQALVEPVRVRFIRQYKSRHPRTINMSDTDFVLHASRQLQCDENALARILFVPVASRQEALQVLKQLLPLFTKAFTKTFTKIK